MSSASLVVTEMIPRYELAPQSTPPGPVTISTRLTVSIGYARQPTVRLALESNSDNPSITSKLDWAVPREIASWNIEWLAWPLAQPGTESMTSNRSSKPRSRISSSETTVRIAGASWTVVIDRAAVRTTLARSSSASEAASRCASSARAT